MALINCCNFAWNNKITDWEKFYAALPLRARRSNWLNIGGQLFPQPAFNTFKKDIYSGKIKSWDEVIPFIVPILKFIPNKNCSIFCFIA